MTELTPEQHKAIKKGLATAPKIQKDLRNYISKIIEPYDKVGLDDSIFEFAELVGYRINNSLPKIAEDLDVKSLYGIKKNETARKSVNYAFRGHNNKKFKPDYQFNGLFGKGVHGTKINDIIEGIRYEKGGLIGGRNRMELLSDTERIELGRKGGRKGGLIGGRATVETHGDQMRNGGLIGGLIGGRKLASMINPETEERYVVEAGRKGNEAQGFHVFSLEEIADIHTFREESIGKGRYKTLPCWNDTTSNMNEKYGENWSTKKVKDAYHYNKDLLADEEE